MSDGLKISIPTALAVAGVLVSLGVGWGILGGDIKANAIAIEGLSKTVAVVDEIQVQQGRADEIQKSQARDIAGILKILEDRLP